MAANIFIKKDVLERYGIDIDSASVQDLLKIEEIITRDNTMDDKYENTWDYSSFQNLKIIDCSYNPLGSLDLSKNINLEQISWCGVRGRFSSSLDLSYNKKLKKITGGQDGLIELDLSSNTELTEICMFLNSSFRWIDLTNVTKLKRITLTGVNIPFVDLTGCNELEYVKINYMNLYRKRSDVFGPGYPRPVIFVNENFDENVIDKDDREYQYYTYKLVRVLPNSHALRVLNVLKNLKKTIVNIPPDIYGNGVGKFHYSILNLLNDKTISDE